MTRYWYRQLVVMTFLIGMISPVLACDKSISFAYGPYVTLNRLQAFEVLHRYFERSTGCAVEFQAYSSIEVLMSSLLDKKHTFAFVPGIYYQAMEQHGYSLIASMSRNQSLGNYVITQHDSPFTRLTDLRGRSVAILDLYASSSLSFVKELEKLGMRDTVKFQVINNYEEIVLKVFEYSADGGVVVGTYWNQIDEMIRKRNLKVIHEFNFGGKGGFIGLKQEKELAKRLLESLIQLLPDTWSEPIPSDRYPEAVKALMQRLKANQVSE